MNDFRKKAMGKVATTIEKMVGATGHWPCVMGICGKQASLSLQKR
jgi:hypothetical protein